MCSEGVRERERKRERERERGEERKAYVNWCMCKLMDYTIFGQACLFIPFPIGVA